MRRGGLWEVFWPLRGGVVFWSFSGSPLQSSFAMEKKKVVIAVLDLRELWGGA